MTELWRPFGFDDSSTSLYDALHDGVPPWMAGSFWDWMRDRLLRSQLTDDVDIPGGYEVFLNKDLVRQAERRCRIALSYSGDDLFRGMEIIRQDAEAQNAELVIADYLLSTYTDDYAGTSLNMVLEESGSMWRAAKRSGVGGLVRRVPDGVQSAVDKTISSGGLAGNRLGQAWTAAFGISPNPSNAYSLAVKAVEDASIPVVSPNDPTATLGKINSQMRNTGDWSLPMPREDEFATTSQTVLSMMKMLWAGQADRHGGRHGADAAITQEAAEVAVITAVALVQWFTSGAVARRK